MFFAISLLPWLAGWVCVCVCICRVIMKQRWSSPGPRCDISQAPSHPHILLPLCILPNSPASGLASSHSGVARDDSHRTVSSQPVSMEFFPAGYPTLLAKTLLSPSPSPSPSPFPVSLSHCVLETQLGIASPSRFESNSTCRRNSSPSRKYSKAQPGKGVGRSLRKRDRSQVVHRLRLSATGPCSECQCAGKTVPNPAARGRCEASLIQ